MEKSSFTLGGQVVDVVNGRIFPGIIHVVEGVIAEVLETVEAPETFLLPGLIDAHIHVESSMLIPSEFARLAAVHGTIGTVSDPHEIGNVLGMDGVRFMIRNGKKVPFRFYFGAPSCVPATLFETAGAAIDSGEIEEMLQSDDIWYLSEMMNFPGVLSGDPEVVRKLELARKYGKPVDGHAPGVSEVQAAAYAGAGITTDHECFTLEEAEIKIRYGMSILIREGSAARNFHDLAPLIDMYPEHVMFCSDDKHPDDLVEGHINLLVKRAIRLGYDRMKVLRACTLNPVRHYRLDAGLLQTGDKADIIRVDSLENFTVLETWIGGKLVARDGRCMIPSIVETPVNLFNASPVTAPVLAVPVDNGRMKVIQALDGQLITPALLTDPTVMDGQVVSDTGRDLLKIVVKDRYSDASPAVGFIHGFGLKRGAIASSVAHDSHNVIAVGADDDSLVQALNLVIGSEGGVALVDGRDQSLLQLPFAGIMSGLDGKIVAEKYLELDHRVKAMGSRLNAPFMTLSFMALLVIPELKMSDRGLFDSNTFSATGLWEK